MLDPHGAPLGRITLRRRRAFRWGRTRWTVEPAAGQSYDCPERAGTRGWYGS
ncbi:hypothetical protein [Streptomyces coeruleorubidus]|uniref:hypothetical protein n=1 Tax=Streptomyces coeruleorubidus TaxID=116188 RepID=UPI0033B9FEC9